jgi:hypothetical protein
VSLPDNLSVKSATLRRVTAADLQRRIVQLEERLRQLSLETSFAARELEMCREHLRLLQSDPKRIMVKRTMDIDTSSLPDRVKWAAKRARREHPALVAFYTKGATVQSIAKELGEGRPRVDSWMRGNDARPIPNRCKVYLRVKYGIPDAAWSRTAAPEPGDDAWLKKRGIVDEERK